jgi:hypothetical protein
VNYSALQCIAYSAQHETTLQIVFLTFVQLASQLSNEVTDTLESSSILINLILVKGMYTQKGLVD